MGFINNYPYTDFHELNLDWLLNQYKGLVSRLNEINAWITQHKIDYANAIVELNRLSNEIDTFEASVNAEFERLKEEQQRQLDQALASIDAQVDAKIRQLTNEVQAAIDLINTQFEQLQLQIQNEITAFKAQINREIMFLNGKITANNDYVFTWVENRIQEFIDSLPEILSVEVYNPYRGEVTDIQTAINDIYAYTSIWGLTALQYDTLGLTALSYDNKHLSAADYDTMGYRYLYPDENVYMISPFTGELTLVKDVVLRLCYFHMEGLTAEEYDFKDLTAEYYDSLNITAFDYDWFGEQIIA